MKAKKSKYFKAAKSNTDKLVVYFSAKGFQANGMLTKGNTAILAEIIKDELHADLFELVSNDEHYPNDYRPLLEISKKDIDSNARPMYQEDVPDFAKYKYIFIGGPAWFFYWPMINYTFLDNHDLTDKTLIPFATHAGSGLKGIDDHLIEMYPNNKVLKGISINGSDTQADKDHVKKVIKNWLTSILQDTRTRRRRSQNYGQRFFLAKIYKKTLDTYIPRDMMYTVKRGMLWMLN